MLLKNVQMIQRQTFVKRVPKLVFLSKNEGVSCPFDKLTLFTGTKNHGLSSDNQKRDQLLMRKV